MEKIQKKVFLAVFLAVVLSVVLGACSHVSEGTDDAITSAITGVDTTEKAEDVYLGTWTCVGVLVDGETVPISDISNEEWKSILMPSKFVFRESGDYYFSIGDRYETKQWKVYDGGVVCDGEEEPLTDGRIHVVLENGATLLYAKVSDSQEFPQNIADSQGSSAETDTTDDMRPEFVEAMDRYEDFFTKYCDFMAKYQENPTDLTLLSEYSAMLTEYSEMMASLDAWGEEDLNPAELAYYLEVTNRITQKLLAVS